jgi:DNA sulfur modification protein DndD
MKMSILELEYKNIRKISSLQISFRNDTGGVIKNNFVMMANGTGKTTTMTLIKGLLDGSAKNWPVDYVKSFAPTTTTGDKGEFSITVKFDEKQYKYFLSLDYVNGIAKIETQAPPKGRETGLLLPTAIKGIFTPEFVSRFVFDGEQAKKSMDRTSNEADETIRYLYRLDELDEILAMNMNILTEIQNAEGGSTGTRGSLSNLRSRQKKVRDHIASLEKKQKQLNGDIARFSQEKIEKEKQRQELDKNYEALNKEKNEVIAEQEKNRGNVDVKITEIVSLVKTPYLVSEGLCNRMYEFGDAMKKLKLPKSSSKDFFTELAYAEKCVCDRCIGEKERDAILKNAERYLGSDHQAVLNNIKSVLMGSTYDEHLVAAFEELGKLQEQKTRLNARFADVEDKLIKAGGPQVEQLQSEIEVLIGQISSAQTQLKIIESKDEDDETLTEENNLHKARRADAEYEVKIASTTKTNAALRKKNVVQDLVNEIKTQATAALKEEIIKKANDKISRVIKDDYIEIESIDGYIKLKDREGASDGQTLSIGYCFLGTLFEEAELEFPFVIDSPTGKMDFDKRQAVADIIPVVFNQMIAFVQSAEVKCFADRFYKNTDTQYLTIVASKDTEEIAIHKGIAFFDSYQRETTGGES